MSNREDFEKWWESEILPSLQKRDDLRSWALVGFLAGRKPPAGWELRPKDVPDLEDFGIRGAEEAMEHVLSKHKNIVALAEHHPSSIVRVLAKRLLAAAPVREE